MAGAEGAAAFVVLVAAAAAVVVVVAVSVPVGSSSSLQAENPALARTRAKRAAARRTHGGYRSDGRGDESVRLYAEVARRSFRRWSTYRAATIAGIFTNSVFGMIRGAVLIAVVQARPGAGGLTETGFITFSFLTQALMSFVGVFGDGDEIGQRVRTGDVVCDFYRPSDFQLWWLGADVGRGLFQLLGRGVPIVLLGALVYGLQWPSSSGAAALFTASLVRRAC